MSRPMSDTSLQLAAFLARAERLLERLEPLLPPASPLPDWDAAIAFRWRKRGAAFFQGTARKRGEGTEGQRDGARTADGGAASA